MLKRLTILPTTTRPLTRLVSQPAARGPDRPVAHPDRRHPPPSDGGLVSPRVGRRRHPGTGELARPDPGRAPPPALHRGGLRRRPARRGQGADQPVGGGLRPHLGRSELPPGLLRPGPDGLAERAWVAREGPPRDPELRRRAPAHGLPVFLQRGVPNRGRAGDRGRRAGGPETDPRGRAGSGARLARGPGPRAPLLLRLPAGPHASGAHVAQPLAGATPGALAREHGGAPGLLGASGITALAVAGRR